ncbi:MAG: NAD(P)H-dependent oxidoreductase [Limosilactobacillus sp.]|uniref:NAD(P)H-dependent oxidoreductase n=1 Tax=Limosilactobacillus sp. TaxID=2773925 RepID=UPI0026FDB07B|nr:NAD(P)H-dependent oxidoreductase [Limosilactobacillus sp.]
MKILALVGTNANFSYNRILLHYMKKHFNQMADIEVYEISKLPAFSVDVPLSEQTEVWNLKQKVKEADGVVFSTPEYDHGIPAALKSATEWLSYKTEVLKHKPCMVVGVSYGRQASARSQVQMRQILISPDCDANLLPGHEVLIGGASRVFSKDGRLINDEMRDNLEDSFTNFIEYIQVFKNFEGGDKMAYKRPTISDAYINFPTGRMSLREVQQIFSTIPFEIDLVDSSDRFAWFSDNKHRLQEHSLASLNEPVSQVHSPKSVPGVMKIINSFRSGEEDIVNRPVWLNGERVLIQYYALRDIDGHYLGTIKFTGSVEFILALFENNAWGEKPADMPAAPVFEDNDDAPVADASTGASESESEPAEQTSSEPVAPAFSAVAEDDTTDASTGASESGSVDADDETADATTGASEN